MPVYQYLDDIDATTAELNILEGVTAANTELNILDGVTATTAELNYLDLSTAANADETTFLRGDGTWASHSRPIIQTLVDLAQPFLVLKIVLLQ